MAEEQGLGVAESEEEVRARKEREKDELYSLDISGVEWVGAPGTEEDEERVEIAYLPGGGVAMRSSLDKETVLRYTEAEWRAFVLGARDGEFDLTPVEDESETAAGTEGGPPR
ncbi:DUF397 domain-containing protein [Streptomyces sp. NPDC059578]|uniref:DUF397 domain-containing protein n=1 Tax=Streptomyces sp. NPDC059578 TaxID=3346874 RepID=UPI0036B57633